MSAAFGSAPTKSIRAADVEVGALIPHRYGTGDAVAYWLRVVAPWSAGGLTVCRVLDDPATDASPYLCEVDAAIEVHDESDHDTWVDHVRNREETP